MEGNFRKHLPPPFVSAFCAPPSFEFFVNLVFTVCAGGKPGAGAVQQAEPRGQRNVEGRGGDHAGSKLEGKGFAISLHPPQLPPQPPCFWGPGTSAVSSIPQGMAGRATASGVPFPTEGKTFKGQLPAAPFAAFLWLLPRSPFISLERTGRSVT